MLLSVNEGAVDEVCTWLEHDNNSDIQEDDEDDEDGDCEDDDKDESTPAGSQRKATGRRFRWWSPKKTRAAGAGRPANTCYA